MGGGGPLHPKASMQKAQRKGKSSLHEMKSHSKWAADSNAKWWRCFAACCVDEVCARLVLSNESSMECSPLGLAAWGPVVSLSDSLFRSTFRLGSFDNYSLPLATKKNPLLPEIVGHRLSSAIKGTICFAEGSPYPDLCLQLDVHTRPLPYTGSCL